MLSRHSFFLKLSICSNKWSSLISFPTYPARLRIILPAPHHILYHQDPSLAQTTLNLSSRLPQTQNPRNIHLRTSPKSKIKFTFLSRNIPKNAKSILSANSAIKLFNSISHSLFFWGKLYCHQLSFTLSLLSLNDVFPPSWLPWQHGRPTLCFYFDGSGFIHTSFLN